MQNLYDRLNKILRSTIENSTTLTELYDAYNLSKIIFDSKPISINHNFTQTLSLNESIDTSYNFFNSIDPMYANQLLNIIMYEKIDNKPAVKFDRIKRIGNIIFNFSGLDEKGNVYISYSNTIMDICTIVHESTHKFSTQYNEESIIKDQLCEVPTITMEFKLREYLLKNTNYNKNDIEYIGKHRIKLTYEATLNILFETLLVGLYIENGYVDEKNLTEYINSLKFNAIINKKHEYLKQIYENNNLMFKTLQRYVIGTLLGIYISEQDNNIDILNKLISILGNSDITHNRDIILINKLNLPCIKDGSICVTNSELDILANAFKQKIKRP